MLHEIIQKPVTHIAWSPFFDQQGKFRHFVKVGEGYSKVGQDGKVSAEIVQYARVTGYDCGYVCVLPVGEQPSAPPPEILEAARFDAQQRAACVQG